MLLFRLQDVRFEAAVLGLVIASNFIQAGCSLGTSCGNELAERHKITGIISRMKHNPA